MERRKGKLDYTFDYEGGRIQTQSKRAISAKLAKIYINTNSKVSQDIKTDASTKASMNKSKSYLRARSAISSGVRNRGKTDLLKKYDLGNLNRQDDQFNGEKQEYIRHNAEQVVQNFKLKEGVTLKTRHYILKNKKSKNSVQLADGSSRMTKRYFDKNLSGKHSRVYSAGPMNQRFHNITDHIKNMERGQKELDQSELIKGINLEPLASVTSEASNARSGRDVKIYMQNYVRFIKDSTKHVFERVNHQIQDSDLSETSNLKFSMKQNAEDDHRLYLMNQKIRNQRTMHRRVNRPVDEYMTSKNLNFFHRKKKKGSRVQSAKAAEIGNQLSGLRQRRDTKNIQRNLVSAGGKRRNMNLKNFGKRPKSTMKRIRYIENNEKFS